MISFQNISVRFGNQVALDDVNLRIEKGERLAVVGENGAGKSTLMNVLFGLVKPASGSVVLNGVGVNFKNPQDALAAKIGMVHQHFTLVPTLTVTENVVLGHEPQKFGFVDSTRAQMEVKATCTRLQFDLNVNARISDLSVGSQQKVEILKALHFGATTLILDEPTAVLTPQETIHFFEVLDGLSKSGVTLILISHRLSDVMRFATRVAVLRRGKLVGEVKPKETTQAQLAELMVGTHEAHPIEQARSPSGEVVLEAKEIHSGKLSNISFSIRSREIVGFAGVDGNGQLELQQVLTGLTSSLSGTVRVLDHEMAQKNPAQFRALGVHHIPEDRLSRALARHLSAQENMALGFHSTPRFSKGQSIDFKARQLESEQLMEGADVRPRNPNLLAKDFSGGNQQKLVVARELSANPKVLVVAQPTRGLDFSAEASVHEQLLKARNNGCAVALFSLDLSELLALSDRIFTLYQGKITGEFAREHFNELAIGKAMLGVKDA
jgi:general nucleoside transport system ATP-binding protein